MSTPYSVGLAGDGDEVAAIEDVERVFGVKLDTRDAPRWRTAGDVFRSLRNAGATDPDWGLFAEVLAGQTGIESRLLTPESPLLLPASSLWQRAAVVGVMLGIMAAAVAIFR